MLLITLEAAKAIRAERCSPIEKAEQDLQLAKHADPLGRAKGLDASPHCFTHFNQDNPPTWPSVHFFKQAQEQRYRDHEMTCFHVEIADKGCFFRKEEGSGEDQLCPRRARQDLF